MSDTAALPAHDAREFAALVERYHAIGPKQLLGMSLSVWILLVVPWLFVIAGASRTVFQKGFWGSAVLAVAVTLVVLRRGEGRKRSLGLVCPSCKHDLVGSQGRGAAFNESLVLDSGLCPGCGVRLFDVDPAVTSKIIDRSLTPLHYLGFGILLGAFGTMALVSNIALRNRREATCLGWYSEARNAADSAQVSAARLSRKTSLTCADVVRHLHERQAR